MNTFQCNFRFPYLKKNNKPKSFLLFFLSFNKMREYFQCLLRSIHHFRCFFIKSDDVNFRRIIHTPREKKKCRAFFIVFIGKFINCLFGVEKLSAKLIILSFRSLSLSLSWPDIFMGTWRAYTRQLAYLISHSSFSLRANPNIHNCLIVKFCFISKDVENKMFFFFFKLVLKQPQHFFLSCFRCFYSRLWIKPCLNCRGLYKIWSRNLSSSKKSGAQPNIQYMFGFSIQMRFESTCGLCFGRYDFRWIYSKHGI